ncbi:MAG: TylF/MycF/NovP-related O-methyltransferase [Candidatus Binataceae bacterium]
MGGSLSPAFFDAHLGFDGETEINAILPLVSNFTLLSYQRIATLWQQVRYLDRRGIPGALVECGVWKGGAAATMALAHLKSSPTPSRHLHLFDSFAGLPEPRAIDGPNAVAVANGNVAGGMRPINKLVAAINVSRELIAGTIGYPQRLMAYHVGWFADTVGEAAPSIGPIALLHLDGDWYDSTKVCLDALYPLVSSGGIVVIDDYGHFEGCRRAVDEFISRLPHAVLLNHIDYSGRYWIKPDSAYDALCDSIADDRERRIVA